MCVCESVLYMETHRYGPVHTAFAAGTSRNEDALSSGAKALSMAAVAYHRGQQRL